MAQNSEDRSSSRDDEPTISNVDSQSGDSSSAAPDSGHFAPGQLIAGRFRIVNRLGGGGMGEVYRADDHELGTSVALKFLPAELAGDSVRLERLRNEVRLARQVAHPNVCRVYDIGDADGRPFLSMEFIDGEDLASLLRRIGRLPKDKAVDLAREICAGVGAAHELGVVHRDLKPANVMIDGRGRARVADFGLAGVADELAGGRDAMAGTPAYMAPEQIAGRGATKKTDIFALGLVLYELFTGRRAHDVKTVAGLKERYSTSAPPTSPSDLVEGMDLAVERVIMHCLEQDPENRPAGALAVMAALPGGDPLAAMLKAGEMPSPELIAASGRSGTMTSARALQLGAIVFLGIAVSGWYWGVPGLVASTGGILAPEVLMHRAGELLDDLGFNAGAADSAWSLEVDWNLVAQAAPSTDSDWKALLQSEDDPVVRFWSRTSPEPMGPWRTALPGPYLGDVVRPEDPPLTAAGMSLIRLGPRGRLLELRVVPDSVPRVSPRTVEEMVATVTEAAELDPSRLDPLEWAGISPMPGEETIAWRAGGTHPEGRPREIVMTLAQGDPTWVRVGEGSVAIDTERSGRTLTWLSIVFFAFFVVGAAVAWFHIRNGRWDRRGAARLAAGAFILCFSSSLIGSHHPLSAAEEVRGFFSSVAYGATRALMTWVLYIALEPFIRRLHPRSLVSWSRLLSGRVRDPAVGRDVLIATALFGLQFLAMPALIELLDGCKIALPLFAFSMDENPLALTNYLAAVVRYPVVTLGSALGFLLVYVFARRILGRLERGAPLVLSSVIFLFSYGTTSGPVGPDRLVMAAFAAVSALASTYLAVRHGLLAFAIFQFFQQVSLITVVTLDPTAWYFPPTAVFFMLISGLTIFGMVTATDRKLIPSGSQ